jgi:hypothetical protein
LRDKKDAAEGDAAASRVSTGKVEQQRASVRGNLQRAIEAYLEGGSFFEPEVAIG